MHLLNIGVVDGPSIGACLQWCRNGIHRWATVREQCGGIDGIVPGVHAGIRPSPWVSG